MGNYYDLSQRQLSCRFSGVAMSGSQQESSLLRNQEARAGTLANRVETFRRCDRRASSRGSFASRAIAENGFRISASPEAGWCHNHHLQMFAEIEAVCLTMQETVFHRRD